MVGYASRIIIVESHNVLDCSGLTNLDFQLEAPAKKRVWVTIRYRTVIQAN